jgi:hypothetical protein
VPFIDRRLVQFMGLTFMPFALLVLTERSLNIGT